MFNEKIIEILKHEGPASFATLGSDGIHLAATWNSYIEVLHPDTLLIPAGYLNQTQRNVEAGSEVQMIIGSKNVIGTQGNGSGFLLKGKAKFEQSGPNFEKLKSRFNWLRAAMVFNVKEVKELI